MMNVYFTVDTESSMAGAWRYPERLPLRSDVHVFCKIGGKDYGIGLITDILQRYGFRATHFLETLVSSVNGSADLRPVFDYLLSRNQDVQLHVHPTYHFFSLALSARASGSTYVPPENNDLLWALPESLQMDVLGRSAEVFEALAGRRPIAFRAGCFAASRFTLRCLNRLGILLDSSFNPCYPAVSFPSETLQPNCVANMEGVWEIPVTVARTPLRESGQGWKHADPSSLSVGELRTMLEGSVAGGLRHFVFVFHSFSAVKTKDETYRGMRPDALVIDRLERLAAYLASRPDLYRVSTFGELGTDLSGTGMGEAPVTKLGFLQAGFRKAIQGVNRIYWI